MTVNLTRQNLNQTRKRNAGRLFVPYSAMRGCLDAYTLTFGDSPADSALREGRESIVSAVVAKRVVLGVVSEVLCAALYGSVRGY